jgi:N-acetyl-alpha-D-glucosaminyl L-malate synthase BshA
VAYSIESSDAVTAVSNSLRAATQTELGVERPIAVIPNFLDCEVFRRLDVPHLRARFSQGEAAKVITHVSNLRPVKRIDTVMAVFARIAKVVPSRLLIVGDGPELGTVYRLGRELGISNLVDALGSQDAVIPLLSASDLFLLPSAQESFGLAALEAMACEVPVVASDVGGLPEVIESGRSGFLHPMDDVEGMAATAVRLLTEDDLHRRIAVASRLRVVDQFCVDRVLPMYEECYESVLATP